MTLDFPFAGMRRLILALCAYGDALALPLLLSESRHWSQNSLIVRGAHRLLFNNHPRRRALITQPTIHISPNPISPHLGQDGSYSSSAGDN